MITVKISEDAWESLEPVRRFLITIAFQYVQFRKMGYHRKLLAWAALPTGLIALMVGSELIDPLTDQQLEHISDNYGPASFFSTAAVGILLLEILLSLVGLGLGSRTDRWIAAIFGSACGALLFGVVWNDEALSTRVEKVTHLRVVSVAGRFGLR